MGGQALTQGDIEMVKRTYGCYENVSILSNEYSLPHPGRYRDGQEDLWLLPECKYVNNDDTVYFHPNDLQPVLN